MIFLNFKLYKETFGQKAIEMAKICKKVEDEIGIKIYPVVSALDAYRIKKEVEIDVIVQNIDEYDEGAKTGYVSILQSKEIGIKGSLINHSEHRQIPGTIKKILKKWPKDMISIVCIDSFGKTEKWAKNIKPNYIAYEPKYLIGNKDKSVATEKPEVIKKFVDFYKDIPVIIGAGINNPEDVRISIKLGAKGILVSSAVIKSEDPYKILIGLAKAFLV